MMCAGRMLGAIGEMGIALGDSRVRLIWPKALYRRRWYRVGGEGGGWRVGPTPVQRSCRAELAACAVRHRAGGGTDGWRVCEGVRGTASRIPHAELHWPMLLTTASRRPLPFAQGRSLRAVRPASPGEGEVHEADDGEAEQGDGVRPVEEVDGDVLHLLLVDHPEMHLVVHIIFAQGPAPHAGRHGPPPRPAAAAAAAPAREGWDPGGDEPQQAGSRTAGPSLARSTNWEQREGQAREGGVEAPPTRTRAGGGAGRASAGVPAEASLRTRGISDAQWPRPKGSGVREKRSCGPWPALFPPPAARSPPAQPRR